MARFLSRLVSDHKEETLLIIIRVTQIELQANANVAW
jgi:hypothetical protein